MDPVMAIEIQETPSAPSRLMRSSAGGGRPGGPSHDRCAASWAYCRCGCSHRAHFGPGFTSASDALALLALYPALAAITVTQTQAMWATDRPGRTSLISILRLLVTLGLVIVLTPDIGVTGPAIALLAGYAAAVLLGGAVLRPVLSRPLRATWPLRERLALLGAYAAGFVAAQLVQHSIYSLAALPLGLTAGMLAYAAVFLAAGGLNARDRVRLIELLEIVRSWRERRTASTQPPAQLASLDGARVEAEKLADPLVP